MHGLSVNPKEVHKSELALVWGGIVVTNLIRPTLFDLLQVVQYKEVSGFPNFVLQAALVQDIQYQPY